MSRADFCRTSQCIECPWRREAPVGVFPLERFALLRPSVEQGFGKGFACHMSREGGEHACVGWLHNQLHVSPSGPQNFQLRLACSRGEVSDRLVVDGPQYESFDEMVEANAPLPAPPVIVGAALSDLVDARNRVAMIRRGAADAFSPEQLETVGRVLDGAVAAAVAARGMVRR